MGRPRYWDVRRAVRKSVRTVFSVRLRLVHKSSSLKNLSLWALDSRFRALPQDVWEQILAYNLIKLEHYKSEHFDCDNFAVCLAGDVAQRWDINGIGVVIDVSAYHAYNCVLADDGGRFDLLMVEPQTDLYAATRECIYRASIPIVNSYGKTASTWGTVKRQ